ncbi:hypothetical protein TcCL_ESM03786 [Trypanosoma cruzi]|nr:hypothetical protein TcCL_ESM03786 [Trypanosoma cruzi]
MFVLHNGATRGYRALRIGTSRTSPLSALGCRHARHVHGNTVHLTRNTVNAKRGWQQGKKASSVKEKQSRGKGRAAEGREHVSPVLLWWGAGCTKGAIHRHIHKNTSTERTMTSSVALGLDVVGAAIAGPIEIAACHDDISKDVSFKKHLFFSPFIFSSHTLPNI